MKLLVLFGLLVTTLTALSFVIRGEWLINLIPVVQRFRQAHSAWGKLAIKSDALKSKCVLDQIVQWRFEEVSDPENAANVLDEVRHKRFGDVVTVVRYKERYLRQLAREMRTYSGVFLILLMTGVLNNADQFAGKTISQISEAVLTYHVIPLLEVIMMVYLFIRLIVETQSINSLLEGG